jgi:hypothetical protein
VAQVKVEAGLGGASVSWSRRKIRSPHKRQQTAHHGDDPGDHDDNHARTRQPFLPHAPDYCRADGQKSPQLQGRMLLPGGAAFRRVKAPTTGYPAHLYGHRFSRPDALVGAGRGCCRMLAVTAQPPSTTPEEGTSDLRGCSEDLWILVDREVSGFSTAAADYLASFTVVLGLALPCLGVTYLPVFALRYLPAPALPPLLPFGILITSPAKCRYTTVGRSTGRYGDGAPERP